MALNPSADTSSPARDNTSSRITSRRARFIYKSVGGQDGPSYLAEGTATPSVCLSILARILNRYYSNAIAYSTIHIPTLCLQRHGIHRQRRCGRVFEAVGLLKNHPA